MNRAFRLIWSTARGAYVVAPESAKGHAKSSCSPSSRAMLVAAIGSGLFGVSSFAFAQVNAATTVVPTGGNTNAYIAPNGVPVVNINTANAAGLSHNKYTRYDVESVGLVLNNGNTSEIARQSQLAGQVMANVNLAAEARVILNEVVSTRRSTLAGFTEVLGGKADVIVANPNGITCSGCGFINTDRATLTTGMPGFNADGSLSHFTVTRGDILINGAGLNASAQQTLDLVTRSIRIDSQINTAADGSIGVTTGTNKWSYASRSVTGTATGEGAAPEYAIDSSALGGMYAGRIRLIATEAGVGVRMLGEAAATVDDFTLTSAGKIEIQSTISAARDNSIASSAASGTDDVLLNGSGAKLSAGNDLAITATAGQVRLAEGELFASSDLSVDAATMSDASTGKVRFAGKDSSVNLSGAASANGSVWGAGGDLEITAADIQTSNGARLYSGANSAATSRSLSIQATSGDIDLADTEVLSTDDVTLTASNGEVALSASTDVQVADELSVTAIMVVNSGDVAAGGDIEVIAQGGGFINSGRVESGGDLGVGDATRATDLFNQSGGELLGKTLSVNAGTVGNDGTVQAVDRSTVVANRFINSAGSSFIASTTSAVSGVGDFNVSSTFDNQGLVQSAGALDIQAGSTLTNSGQILALRTGNGGSNGDLDLNAWSIDNSGTIDGGGLLNATATATTGTSFTNSGALQAGGAMHLDVGNAFQQLAAGKIIADSTLNIGSATTSFLLTNAGRLQSAALLTIGGVGHLVNLNNLAGGNVLSQASLALTAGSISNAGTIQAATGSTVNATSFTNSGSASRLIVSTAANADGSLAVSGAIDNQGTIQSAGGLNVVATAAIANSGTVKTTGLNDTLALQGNTLNNTGFIDSADLATLTATRTAGDVLTNSGQVRSTDTLTIVSGDGVSNVAGGTMIGDGAVDLTALVLTNAGRIQSGTAMTLGRGSRVETLDNSASGVLFAGSTMNILAGWISNQGKIYGSSGTTLTASSLTNGSASNSSALLFGAMNSGASQMTVSGSVSNYGAIHSNDTLSVAAAGVTNQRTGGISSLASLNVSATSGNSIDNYGAFYAGTALALSATGGTIRNRPDGATMDSGGSITTTSASFINNAAIVALGDITITATSSFTNETTLDSGVSISKQLGSTITSSSGSWNKIANEGSLDNGMNAWLLDQTITRNEELVGITEAELSAKTKAQIIGSGAGSTLSINYGGSGHNYIAVLSAPRINVSGSGTFTNEDLTLYTLEHTRRIIRIEDESIGDDDFVVWARTDSSRSGYNGDNGSIDDDGNNWDNWSPGWGWTRTRHVESGSYPSALTNEGLELALSGAQFAGASTRTTFGAGIFATSFNFSGGTLNNVGSPYPASPEHAKQSGTQSDSVTGLNPGAGTSSTAMGVTGTTATAGTAAGAVVAGSTLAFGGVNITLPSNPNGYFVVSRDPNSRYLVETNPLFAVGSNFVGSDYLQNRYGYNPDTVLKRLGDSNYEAYLIRQQLIAETGSNVLKGYGDEAAQMQQLMDQAVDQGAALGLVYGQALTPTQIANLQEDIVWMEEVEVGGQKVLAPRVYLSQSSRDMIAGGAVISADDVTIAGDALNNTGGTIQGANTLTVTTTGDITNTSGTIRGGDVSLTSTEGNITNRTLVEGAGDDINYSTTIGRTGGIEATGNLDMSANKDISVIGADVRAGGDASLEAGGDITFDTIVDKTTRTTSESTNFGPLYGSSTTTTETTETNTGSNLQTGGNLKLNSGGDTTIAGSNADVGGDLDVDTGGDFNVIARQDKVTTKTVTETSGVGVGGGVWGTEKTTTDSFKGTNVGSTLNVGGNADIDAKNEMTIQGSDVAIGGDANITATKGINILDGLDEERTTTVTETTTFLKTGSSGESDSGSKSASASESASGRASADASANANAEASGSADLKFAETTVSTTNAGSNTSVASSLTVGGNLNASTEGTLRVQGSNVESGGDMNLEAENVEVLAGRNETWSNTETTRTSVGIYNDGESSAGANAEAQARAGTTGTNASAGADASAEASGTTTIGARTENEKTTEYTLRNTGSTLKSGGSMNITAGQDATFVGAEVESGGDMNIEATNIVNRAAQDIEERTSSKTTQTAGVYVGADAKAEAKAGTEANPTRLSNSAAGTAEAGAGAEANVSTGLRYNREEESSAEGSVTQVTSSFKSGGNITRTAKDTIVDQGTQIEAAGNIDQSAREIREIAAEDSSYSRSSSSSHDARIGVGAGASAEAGASANSKGESETESGAGAGAGFRASYTGASEGESEASTTAVTTRYKSGGSITSKSEEKTTLIGTQFESGGDINLEAGSLDYQAAKDTTTSSSNSQDISAELKVDVVGKAGGSLDAEYGMEKEGEKTSTARAGGMTAGGSINIKTKGDASFEGTQLEAGNAVGVDAGGNVDFKAARDTTESSSQAANASLSLSSEKGGDKAMGLGGGYEQENGNSSTAQVGSIKAGSGGISISAGKDANFEGTALKSEGDTGIAAGGDVNLRAAKNTETTTSFGVQAEIGSTSGSEGKEKTGAIGGNVGYADKVESTGTSIGSGGTVTIKGNNVINQEADIKAEGGAQIIGNEIKQKAESRDIAIGIEAGYETSSESKTPEKKTGSKTTDDIPDSRAKTAADDKPRSKTTDDLPAASTDTGKSAEDKAAERRATIDQLKADKLKLDKAMEPKAAPAETPAK
jgi:filamentous hemagglutinin family protein